VDTFSSVLSIPLQNGSATSKIPFSMSIDIQRPSCRQRRGT
jgi:hypothetical protein